MRTACATLLSFSFLATTAPAALPTTNPADLDREIARQMTTGKDEMLQADDLDAVPIDAALADYLRSRQPVLDLLHQAAVMHHADWGPVDGDMTKVMGSFNGARAAVLLTWLAARQDMAQNRPADAVTHLIDGFALARHVGQQPLTICNLVEVGCEFGTINRLAKLLPTLPADVAAGLPAKLDGLPSYIGWPAIIDGERAFGRLTLAKQLATPQAADDDTQKKWASAQAMADGLGPIYDAIKGRPGELPDDLRRDIVATLAKMPGNVLAQTLAPSFGRVRESAAMIETRYAMLRVAAATAAGDADAVANSSDPFGHGPFAVDPSPGGYTLRGVLTSHGKPVTLQIGG